MVMFTGGECDNCFYEKSYIEQDADKAPHPINVKEWLRQAGWFITPQRILCPLCNHSRKNVDEELKNEKRM